MKRIVTAGLAVVLVLSMAGAAQAATVGFESPYTTGVLSGQQGWTGDLPITVTSSFLAQGGGANQSVCNLVFDPWTTDRKTDLDIFTDNTIRFDVYAPSSLPGYSKAYVGVSSDAQPWSIAAGVRAEGGGTANFFIDAGDITLFAAGPADVPADVWVRVTLTAEPTTGLLTLSAVRLDTLAAVLTNGTSDLTLATDPYYGTDAASRQASWDLLTQTFIRDQYVAIDNLGGPPIPEPATMSLLALGGLAALIRRRR